MSLVIICFFLVILGGRFGRGSFCLCHLLIESVIGGLSYLGFIIRVLGRVCVRRKLWRLLWCATIYFIWQERNHRLHGVAIREPMVVFQLIRSCIKARAASWSDGVHGLI